MNLNRNDVLEILSQLNFPRDSFWIVMGGALVLHGIRGTTHDIDIGCNDELFEKLKADGHSVFINRFGRERIDYSNILHIYRDWTVDSMDFIGSIQVASLTSIIKDKQILGRPKDLRDIELIQQFLKGVQAI